MNNRYYSREFDVEIPINIPHQKHGVKISSIAVPFVLTGLSLIMVIEAFHPGYYPYDHRIVTGIFCLASFANAFLIFRKLKQY